MGTNQKIFFFGIEIIYNSLGQVFLKKRFLILSTTIFHRYISRGL